MEPPLSPRFNMRRAAVERDRTFREWHRHHLDHLLSIQDLGVLHPGWRAGVRAEFLVSCVCDQQVNRFRKGQRARTQGTQRINEREWGYRTRQEARSDADFRDQLREEGLV
jgi:hypothetical protein